MFGIEITAGHYNEAAAQQLRTIAAEHLFRRPSQFITLRPRSHEKRSARELDANLAGVHLTQRQGGRYCA